MEESILEEFMPYLVDRLGRVYNQDKEYQKAVEKESRIYEELKEGLTEEQRSQLDEYFAATREMAGICEKLSYQQGIKDLFSFCISMAAKGKE